MHTIVSRFMLSAFAVTVVLHGRAQVISDTLAGDFRSQVAKNFSHFRTVNFSWEMKRNHDYAFKVGGNQVEKARKTNLHALHFSTLVPLVKERRASLYANIKYDSYNFDYRGDTPSAIFNERAYDYYAGGLSGFYYLSLCNRPLLLSADVSADGWKKGWGRLQGRLSAVMVVTNTAKNTFSVGLMGMTLFNKVPVMPILSYWHRFDNPNFSVDITLPSQLYLRYQANRQRISAGATMSVENFYLHTDMAGLPSTCFYSDAVMKPEVLYEYIINRHFYLSARVGMSMVLKGGLYTKNRKDIEVPDEAGLHRVDATIKQDRSPFPFFNVGVSYSLFK